MCIRRRRLAHGVVVAVTVCCDGGGRSVGGVVTGDVTVRVQDGTNNVTQSFIITVA